MKNNGRKDGRGEILKRAALAGEVAIQPNGWGLNETIGNQGEWISYTIIQEWEKQGLIVIENSIGTITEKGERGEYSE